jgi:hypothetical protein
MSERRRHAEVADLTEIIRELTDPHEHRQSYRAGWQRANRTGPDIRDHVTSQPALLVALRAAITDKADVGAGGKAGQAPHTTLPRFDTDAFDRMETIRKEVAEWCDVLGMPSQSEKAASAVNMYLTRITEIIDASRTMGRPAVNAIAILRQAAAVIRAAVEPDLIALGVRAAEVDQDTLDLLCLHAGRWRTWCRIIAGWETPPLRPHVPCPECGTVAGERAGLRIRIEGASGTGGILGDAKAQGAVCLTCNATWDADQVGVLAERLRAGERGPTKLAEDSGPEGSTP